MYKITINNYIYILSFIFNISIVAQKKKLTANVATTMGHPVAVWHLT